MRASRIVILMLALCLIVAALALPLYLQHRQTQRAIENYKNEQAQDERDATIVARIQYAAGMQEEKWWLALLQADLSTRQILEREQLEKQYIEQWFATQKANAASKGVSREGLNQIDQAMHKTELMAIQGANDIITNVAAPDGSFR